ncbi:MAG: hypothetical protein HYZ38_25800 [Mycobacterium sp.]|nr:hypothetical protein [Mycobacterium sp.]
MSTRHAETVAGRLPLLLAACALGATGLAVAPAAAADDGMHHVRYTMTTETPFLADIYYRPADPPDWGAYSHDPYLYSPKVEAQLGPGQVWTMDTMLADPDQWAMVVGSSGLHPVDPNFHCTLEVDGTVVKTDEGPKGALCSIRNW